MRDKLASTPNHGYEFYSMPKHLRALVELAHQVSEACEHAEYAEKSVEWYDGATRKRRHIPAKEVTVLLYRAWQQVEEMGAPLLAEWQEEQRESDPVEKSQP